MERRKFLQGAGMAGILAAGTAPAIVHAQQQIRWRLASSFPKSLETVFGASEAFSKYVSDATGGKFVISVHPGGELVPPPSAWSTPCSRAPSSVPTPHPITSSARMRPSPSTARSPSA